MWQILGVSGSLLLQRKHHYAHSLLSNLALEVGLCNFALMGARFRVWHIPAGMINSFH